jgi:hypothetical protein
MTGVVYRRSHTPSGLKTVMEGATGSVSGETSARVITPWQSGLKPAMTRTETTGILCWKRHMATRYPAPPLRLLSPSSTTQRSGLH